jgi:hypothetical protein
VRSAFQKKAEETDDREKEFELARKHRIRYQQNLTARRIGLVVLTGATSNFDARSRSRTS